jgi:hypothetical protein
MLREIKYVKQIPGEPRKSWFSDDFFDLFVWFDDADGITAFQLSYGKPSSEKMLTWNRRSGLGHSRVDDGEPGQAKFKAAPILVRDGPVADSLAEDFRNASKTLDPRLIEFITKKIEQFFTETSRPTMPCMPAVINPKNG